MEKIQDGANWKIIRGRLLGPFKGSFLVMGVNSKKTSFLHVAQMIGLWLAHD